MDRVSSRPPDPADYTAQNQGGSGSWAQAPVPARVAEPQGPARPDDDPLTSKAFSRDALVDTDGRSYRAAHRAQVPSDGYEALMNEETQTFSLNGQDQADSQGPAYTARGQEPYQPQQPSADSATGSSTGVPRGSYPYPDQPYSAWPAPDRHEDPYGTSSGMDDRQPDRGNGTGAYNTGAYNTGTYNANGYSTDNYNTGAYNTDGYAADDYNGAAYSGGYGDPRRGNGRY